MPRSRMEKLSDDAGMMAAVAAQMQSSWEKKRKDKETRYLQHAQEELDRCISGRLEEYITAIGELNGVYENSVIQYAQVEDQIRKLWLQLLQEQQKLLSLAEKKQESAVVNDKDREKGQVKGMAIAKKAVEDFGVLISSLERSC